jgi:hypothetical protein
MKIRDNRIELSQENSLPKWKTTAVPPETGRKKRFGKREPKGRSTKVFWVRICKRLRSPGFDSKESIQPAYVAWRAGTSNRVIRPTRFTNTGSVIYFTLSHKMAGLVRLWCSKSEPMMVYSLDWRTFPLLNFSVVRETYSTVHGLRLYRTQNPEGYRTPPWLRSCTD